MILGGSRGRSYHDKIKGVSPQLILSKQLGAMPSHKKARAAAQPAHLMQMPMMQSMLPWAMNPMQGMIGPMGMQGMMMNPMMGGAMPQQQQVAMDLESDGSEEPPAPAAARPAAAMAAPPTAPGGMASAAGVEVADTQQQAISGLAKSRAALFLTEGQGGQVITRSAAMLRSLPKRKLSEAVEAMDEALDPTVTSDLSTIGLVQVLWLLTRQCLAVVQHHCLFKVLGIPIP